MINKRSNDFTFTLRGGGGGTAMEHTVSICLRKEDRVALAANHRLLCCYDIVANPKAVVRQPCT